MTKILIFGFEISRNFGSILIYISLIFSCHFSAKIQVVSGDDKSGGVYSFEKKDDLEDTYLYGAAKLWRHRPQIFKITPIVIIFLFFSEDK